VDYDALERLVRLRDRGALSDHEFDAQKHLLLNLSDVDDLSSCRQFGHVGTRPPFRNVSVVAFAIGMCAATYSTFVYDTTVSPVDAAVISTSIGPSSSIEDRARAISDVKDRLDRTLAGERLISFPRVQKQRTIFSFGALLMVLGAIGFAIPFLQRPE
jgi:hypothetical protein